jgi:hypothetical protein
MVDMSTCVVSKSSSGFFAFNNVFKFLPLESAIVKVNETTLPEYNFTQSGKEYNYYYSFIPDSTGHYLFTATITDYNTFTANSSLSIHSEEIVDVNITAGADEIVVSDVLHGHRLYNGSSINQSIPRGRYNITVNANKTVVKLGNVSINQSLRVLNVSAVDYGSFELENATYLDQFEINSSSEFETAVVEYNYSHMLSEITREEYLVLYKCENISNCTWESLKEP